MRSAAWNPYNDYSFWATQSAEGAGLSIGAMSPLGLWFKELPRPSSSPTNPTASRP